ncbi:hypothetical protein F4803DRAFT_517605, partial [Xylaria telfairii]
MATLLTRCLGLAVATSKYRFLGHGVSHSQSHLRHKAAPSLGTFRWRRQKKRAAVFGLVRRVCRRGIGQATN